jgi:hypothetical protein
VRQHGGGYTRAAHAHQGAALAPNNLLERQCEEASSLAIFSKMRVYHALRCLLSRGNDSAWRAINESMIHDHLRRNALDHDAEQLVWAFPWIGVASGGESVSY